MKKIWGTIRRIGSIIRRHWRAILRVVRWTAMLVLVILAWKEPRGWWALRTKIEYLGTAVLLLVNTIMVLRAWRTRHRSTQPQSQTQTAPSLPTPAEAAAQAAFDAEAAALAAGASPAAAAAAAQAAAAAAASTPAPTPTPANIAEWRREAGLVTQGKWYYGRIPYTHIPLILLSFKLEGESVTRRFLFVVEDPETFNDIENLDVTPDLGWGRIRGCVTLRILPKKIGVPVNDVWHQMSTKFARALLASWKLYKVK